MYKLKNAITIRAGYALFEYSKNGKITDDMLKRVDELAGNNAITCDHVDKAYTEGITMNKESKITGPFRVTADVIELSNMLDETDLNRWALHLSSVYYVYDTFHDADEAKEIIKRISKVS